MSNITFPKAKVGDKIRLTGKQWCDKETHGVVAGDVVTVTSLATDDGFVGVPRFRVPGEIGEFYIYVDPDEDAWGDWGGELVEKYTNVWFQEDYNTFEAQVRRITGGIADLLIEKNRKYGNSALDPERIFSGASSTEAIRVRIDDKLSRIKTSDPDDQEDSISDLIGYCILLLIAEGK